MRKRDIQTTCQEKFRFSHSPSFHDCLAAKRALAQALKQMEAVELANIASQRSTRFQRPPGSLEIPDVSRTISSVAT